MTLPRQSVLATSEMCVRCGERCERPYALCRPCTARALEQPVWSDSDGTAMWPSGRMKP